MYELKRLYRVFGSEIRLFDTLVVLVVDGGCRDKEMRFRDKRI